MRTQISHSSCNPSQPVKCHVRCMYLYTLNINELQGGPKWVARLLLTMKRDVVDYVWYYARFVYVRRVMGVELPWLASVNESISFSVETVGGEG